MVAVALLDSDAEAAGAGGVCRRSALPVALRPGVCGVTAVEHVSHDACPV